MINWIIFDIDGTLIDTAASNMMGLKITMKNLYNKEFTDEEIRPYMGTPGEEALRNLGVKEEEIPNTWKYWGDRVREYAHLDYVFDGVPEMLKFLSNKYNLAIVTSKTHKQLDDDFVKRGLLQYFKVWVCKEDTKRHKPNPDPLIKALELANIQPCDAIYIGDAMVDYMAANSASIKFGHCRFMDKYDDVHCSTIFNKAEDIIEYFDVIEKVVV